MASSLEWETDSSPDDFEESLHKAQSSEDQSAHDSSSPGQRTDEAPQRIDPTQAENTAVAKASIKPTRLTKEERESTIRAQAEAHNATLEYDENGQLQPVYPCVPSGSSKSFWLHHSTFERDIKADFDQVRSGDLSIHLYNAFKIRQQAKAGIPSENGFVETKEPPRTWTAWPLTHDTVPRNHELWDDDDWRAGPYVKRKRRPGDELRDLLIARATKSAKERFRARESESSGGDDEVQEYLRPAVTTNDEKTEKLLRRSIQHSLAKLDNLLLALHRSRSYYMTSTKLKKGGRKSKGEPSRLGRSSESDEYSIIHAGSDEDSHYSSDFEVGRRDVEKHRRQSTQRSEAEDSTVNSRSHFLATKASKVGLRDWTDIIGVASMTEVDSVVIRRTIFRCDNLFGGNVRVQRIEGGLSNREEGFYLPYGGNMEQISVSRSMGEEIYDNVHVDGFMQPIKGKASWSLLSENRKKSRALEADKVMTVEAGHDSVINTEKSIEGAAEDESDGESSDGFDNEIGDEPDGSGESSDREDQVGSESNEPDDQSSDEDESEEILQFDES